MEAMGATYFPAARSVVDAPQSPVLAGLTWLGEQIPYPEPEKRGDTFPLTWSADDQLYTSAGDPVWGPSQNGLDIERISGDAPTYTIRQLNAMAEYAGWGGAGPKPTGMLSVDDVLYLAFQNLTGKGDAETNGAVMNYGHGYDAHIVCSYDHGLTWEPPFSALSIPMFPGRTFGAPAFINMGQGYREAQDGYVYAISGKGWDNGSHCRLGRVPTTAIVSRERWEWVSGFDDDGSPRWDAELERAIPVLTHPGYLGMVDMVYLSSVRRYLLLSWRHNVKSTPGMGSEFICYDSPTPWGPFTLVHHEGPWETPDLNPYNPRLPLKWFNPGWLEGWLLFSGNWAEGGQTPNYRAHVRPFRLRLQTTIHDH